jgi:CBS domain containing-hemolysin-like protein
MSLIIGLTLLVCSVSFLCSMLEAVFLSISPAYVALALKENKKHGKLLEHLKENIDRPISAILTMNTICNTAGSAAIGAYAHEHFGSVALTTTSVVLTLSILIFAEILPKILGATYWKTLAPFAAYTIQLMIFLVFPIVRLTEVVSNLLGDNEGKTVTREEVIATAEIGVDEGTLLKKESTVIKNLLMLNNMFVSDIMTPRSVAFALDGEMTVEQVVDKHRPVRFSRIPVYESNLDHIVGLVHRWKIFDAAAHDVWDKKIKDLTVPIQSVPERTSVAAVIDLFLKLKQHLFLAVDEYGVVTGIVTLEDAIETLLGVEIVDELDNITDMRQYALDQWQLRKQNFRKS